MKLTDLEIVKETAKEYVCWCPFHEDKRVGGRPNLYVEKEQLLYYCFRCHAKGKLSIDKYIDIISLRNRVNKIQNRHDKTSNTTTNNNVLNILEKTAEPDERNYDFYLNERGIEPYFVMLYDLRFDSSINAAVLQLRSLEHDNLIAYIYRFCNNDSIRRYLYTHNAPISEHLFGANIINIHKLPNRTVVLTEGALDAIRVSQATQLTYCGLAILSSSLSNHQIKRLHRLGAERIILFYDNDNAGRLCTIRSYEKLKNDFGVKIVDYDLLNKQYKDPSEMHDEQIRFLIKESLNIRAKHVISKLEEIT